MKLMRKRHVMRAVFLMDITGCKVSLLPIFRHVSQIYFKPVGFSQIS
ncbi:hypothetical protein BN1221_04272c [Brenneria goodwinii]|uniref:Uncharacterized protein n=1 Tax=Brenneria goodwinii TaxID=1109412 RepID=A0A0G4K1F7_9GAMM|nr:hypothetical protein BN1221_04272c [Brenneria goodwinii]